MNLNASSFNNQCLESFLFGEEIFKPFLCLHHHYENIDIPGHMNLDHMELEMESEIVVIIEIGYKKNMWLRIFYNDRVLREFSRFIFCQYTVKLLRRVLV